MFGHSLSAQSPLLRATRRKAAPQGLVARWLMTRRTRAALRKLDAHLLDDIGMTEVAARQEAKRPFWK